MKNYIDLTEFRCPVPLVQTKLALKSLSEGEKLHVLLSDRGSRQDVPQFIKKQGFEVKELCNDDQVLAILVTKVSSIGEL